MNRLFFLLIILAGATQALAQTKTTEKLDADYDGMSLYFYKNTLRMLNQKEDPAFDDMIKDIEKIRFVLIDRNDGKKFTNSDYAKLKSDYLKKESFEEIMNGRMEGRNLNVLVRESGGKVQGTVIMAGDSSNLYVLDILGKIALEKAGALFKMIDENSDVANKIKKAHID